VSLLSSHDSPEAARELQQALADCPADHAADLRRICWFLGIALLRLGHPQAALRSLISCQRLRKRGPARRMIQRLANDYGMARQPRSMMDDRQAFLSVQLLRYLATRRKRAFSTPAERDMVSDLILDYWKSLERSGELASRSCREKMEIFQGMHIVFPTVVLPQAGTAPSIPVDFRVHRRLGLQDSCFCGSGLPFSLCHGRTRGSEEILSGT
jgi:hypothetical protein